MRNLYKPQKISLQLIEDKLRNVNGRLLLLTWSFNFGPLHSNKSYNKPTITSTSATVKIIAKHYFQIEEKTIT